MNGRDDGDVAESVVGEDDAVFGGGARAGAVASEVHDVTVGDGVDANFVGLVRRRAW